SLPARVAELGRDFESAPAEFHTHITQNAAAQFRRLQLVRARARAAQHGIARTTGAAADTGTLERSTADHERPHRTVAETILHITGTSQCEVGEFWKNEATPTLRLVE